MIFMKMSALSTPVSTRSILTLRLDSEIIRNDFFCSSQVVEAFQPQPSTSSSTSSISSFGGSSRPSSSSSSSKKPSTDVQSDEVDLTLAKSDGRLERKRDPKLCRHNSNGCCVHCSPLEPFDEEYLKEHKIKHLSFHSYIRKLTSGVDRGKFVALEDLVRFIFTVSNKIIVLIDSMIYRCVASKVAAAIIRHGRREFAQNVSRQQSH